MRRVASTVLAGALASIALAFPASASEAHPICVQDYDGTWFSIITTDSPEDSAYIAGRTVKPFPEQGLGGCSAYTWGLAEKQCATANADLTARLEEVTHDKEQLAVVAKRRLATINRLQEKIKRLQSR